MASAARLADRRTMTPSTSSAVTIPSPEVVCSRMMTWPLFSPAEDRARDLHPLEDVLVADRRPHDLAAGRLDDRLEAAVREDRDDQPATRQRIAAQPVEGQDAEHLVAIDDVPRFVDGDQPVGVAVEREPDVGAAGDDRRGQRAPATSRRSRG